MKKSRKFLIFCLLATAVCGIGYLVFYLGLLGHNEATYEKVQKIAWEDRGEALRPGTVIPIDFEALKEINPDVYAWIHIPGTKVDYPILRSSSDDNYYLKHTIDGTAGYPGALYTEKYNSRTFEDFNTVIYGHNMKDDSMFGGLYEYTDPAYWKDRQEVIIYTPEKKLTYQIFAAVVYDDRHILESYNFEEEKDRQAFLDSLNSLRDMRSNLDDEIQVGPSDRILTLSTCIGAEDHHRYLVEAVLVEEE